LEEIGSINLLQHRRNIIEELKKRDKEAKASKEASNLIEDQSAELI